MEEKKHGGKRRGAGRKSVTDKKQQIVLYVPGKDVLKFGSPDKMKDRLKGFIDEFGKEQKILSVQPIPAFFDSPKQTNIQDEYPMFAKPQIALKSFQQHMNHISTLVFADEKTEYMEVVRLDKSLTEKEREKLITSLKF